MRGLDASGPTRRTGRGAARIKSIPRSSACDGFEAVQAEVTGKPLSLKSRNMTVKAGWMDDEPAVPEP